MTIIQAILLGAIQGIAEFIPVSSSGHLVVFQELLGLKDVPLLFDVLLHIPTLIVVMFVFRKRIAALCCSLGRFITHRNTGEDRENLNLTLMIIITTVLTAAIGLGINKLMDTTQQTQGGSFFQVYPWSVGILFLVTAGILIVSGFMKGNTRGYDRLTLKDGIITGIAQGIGVLPGISRSGITISASLLAGIDKKQAGEYSFLISIPAILGATILELKDVELIPLSPVALAAGLITSFIVGFISLYILIRLIKKGKFWFFSFYLIPAGLFTLFYFLFK